MLYTFLDFAGTFAFAISGLRMAAHKEFDWFGAFVVGLVTAVGGGTIRDLCLGMTPFWMTNIDYFIITLSAFVFVLVARKVLLKPAVVTFFIFDTIGLGFFLVVGYQKTIDAGYSHAMAIVMGTITGAAGGVIRDVLLAQIPLIFRQQIYAMACVFGGVLYSICLRCGIPLTITQIIAASGVIAVRLIAERYKIGLPRFKGFEVGDNDPQLTIKKKK